MSRRIPSVRQWRVRYWHSSKAKLPVMECIVETINKRFARWGARDLFGFPLPGWRVTVSPVKDRRGEMTIRRYSQAMLNHIVDRFHVSATDAEVRAEIEMRIKNTIYGNSIQRRAKANWPPAQKRLAVQDALKRHRANRELYNYVMRGGY